MGGSHRESSRLPSFFSQIFGEVEKTRKNVKIKKPLQGRLTCPAKFMPYLYVLRNVIGKYYTGITTTEPEKRLQRHNKGDVYSTRIGRPWQLVYIENYETLKEAREREKQIKKTKIGSKRKI